MNPFIWLITTILSLYSNMLFVWVILSLLISFNVINRWHPIVSKIWEILERLIEPVLRPIRQFIPQIGGFDLSPIVLILGIQFLERSIYYYLVRGTPIL